MLFFLNTSIRTSCIQLLNVFISLIQEYQITTVLTILTTQKSGFEITEEDLFSLLQNIIVLRFVEVQGRIEESLAGIKDQRIAT